MTLLCTQSTTTFARPLLTVLAMSLSAIVNAQQAPPATSSEWGGIGLLQTPTARMANDGDLSFTASHNSPYTRYNLSLQPFPWLESSFRYINVSNLRYGVPEVSGDQNYKDKSIDFKVRLWQESHWLPEVAFGVRDLGGTGFFSSEYLVANKRFGTIDASLGLATGYIGNRGDFSNPLGAINDRFKPRRGIANSDITQAGSFGVSDMFTGPVGVFGGVSWQSPWDPLVVKAEYDGNDYKREPRGNNLRQRTPLNIGLVYMPNPNVELTAAWERGDAAMFALTLRGNPGHAKSAPKPFDPPPAGLLPANQRGASVSTIAETPVLAQATISTHGEVGATEWKRIAGELRDNAGIRVSEISSRNGELFISGYQSRYFTASEGMGRSARILSNALGDQYDWYTFRAERLGLPVADMSMHRQTFEDYLDGRVNEATLRRSIEINSPARVNRELVYKQDANRFGGGFNFGYRQNMGGPDGFILYQINANYSGSFFFTPTTWLTGIVSANLHNNYDKFKYDAPSRLPRVRTDIRQYTTTSDITMPNLQFTATRQLGRDLYGMAYAGYLEWMYAGAGGEVLYRPMGQSWALGANINRVRQRAYEQDFALRDYSVTTGHATLYYTFDARERIIGTLSIGRYLAGDDGATLNIARAFDNGVTMGAYATKTNVSSRDFGEGSFDKGIYFSIPFDTLLPRSTRARANITWNPLIRDGGAMLQRRYALYNATGERDERFFLDNLDTIAD